MSAAMMIDQLTHTAPETPRPTSKLRMVRPPDDWQTEATAAYRRSDWYAEAIATYQQTEQQERGRLAADLAVRVLDLTGQLVEPATVFVNRPRRQAQVRVDGILFRLLDDQLQVVRPCHHCGVGEFASPVIRTRADLGYALSMWQPEHPDCEPFDPAETGDI